MSTLAHAFVPPQVLSPAMNNRQSSLFLYGRTGRSPAKPLSHPNPPESATSSSTILSTTKSSPYGLYLFMSPHLLLHLVSMVKGKLGSTPLSTSVCSGLFQSSALGCSSSKKLRFYHPPLFAQLILSPIADHIHPPLHFGRSCQVCLSHSLHRRDPLSKKHSHACQPGYNILPMRH